MGAYTCEFGVVHKRCRCREAHTIKCDVPDEHKPETYEYVVWDNIDNCIHRGPMSEKEAVQWMNEAIEMFPRANPGAIAKLWSIRRRAVGEWLPHE